MVDKRNDEGDEEKKVHGIQSKALYQEGSKKHRKTTHIVESDKCNYNKYITYIVSNPSSSSGEPSSSFSGEPSSSSGGSEEENVSKEGNLGYEESKEENKAKMGEVDYAIKAQWEKNEVEMVAMQNVHKAIKDVMKAEMNAMMAKMDEMKAEMDEMKKVYKKKSHVMKKEMNTLIKKNKAAMTAAIHEASERKADSNIKADNQDASKKSIFLILH